ncbi:hypothetical protein B8W69_11205 [Mycobacterium vulneris]|uniref:PPE family C-terminal domain-containing protein n=1 Tax=Mycolicibacterium vulneris TaxID=547163 RepID=A0A1X2L379_9MYCO|nr:hypothetical protein B8W69_11205 [Mycolicibacterium vulneris]
MLRLPRLPRGLGVAGVVIGDVAEQPEFHAVWRGSPRTSSSSPRPLVRSTTRCSASAWAWWRRRGRGATRRSNWGAAARRPGFEHAGGGRGRRLCRIGECRERGSRGALSVPPGWAAAGPDVKLAATVLEYTSAGAAPTVAAAGGLSGEMALAGLAEARSAVPCPADLPEVPCGTRLAAHRTTTAKPRGSSRPSSRNCSRRPRRCNTGTPTRRIWKASWISWPRSRV